MAEVGYSSEYEVYLTEKNGVQIVINSLSLSILKIMRSREVSPSDIAITLDVPKSTIQGNISKLLHMGIVTQETRVGDARSVVYHIGAMLLFCSDTDVDWQFSARAASVARIINNGRCTSREDLSLYAASLTESGLNITQGLFNVGAALTRNINDPAWINRMLSNMVNQCKPYGIQTSMDTNDGLNLVFRSENKDISDIPMIVVPMLGAIVSNANRLIGYNLSHEVSLKVTEGGHRVDIHVAMYEGQEYDSSMHISLNNIPPRIDEPFSIYSVHGKAVLFQNPTMMSVLDCLCSSDYSLNELENVTNLSKATIYAAITKLVSMGAVDTLKEQGTVMKYHLSADPILFLTDANLDGIKKLKDISYNFQKGYIDYYSAVISFAMISIECLGIHFDKMFVRAGRNTAVSVLEINPSIQPQEIVDLACNMVSVPDYAHVETYIPIRLRITLSQSTLWESWPSDFVLGFISEGLTHLVGKGYKTIVEVRREGEDSPYAVISA